MGSSKGVMMLVLVAVLAATSLTTGYTIRDSEVRRSQMPRLDIGPPRDMTIAKESAPLAWQPRSPQVEEAIERGRAAARAGKPAFAVLAAWRLVVDEGGEYATFLTPLAVACVLGYQAEERSWPEAKLRQNVEEAIDRFGSGVCVYVELRSFAHESVAFGSAGEIRPGTPGEAYEATFLLDGGSRKYEGVTANLDPERVGEVRINSAGQHYQVVFLPEVAGSATVFREQTTGQSYGANYYVWWPFVDEEDKSIFGSDSTNLWYLEAIRLTVITPMRKREYLLTITPEGLRMGQRRENR